ncbi:MULTISPECIES: ATP-dependent DNA ligase [unclassified Actinotalea]|uniref:ATP-dependent DNA ligase n=1 Tax=unclassified Actinotalea TaxID=2638618 RepID=UPI0015F5BFFD|nr:MULTISPECIES: ATP-dependent DNA ligase [unclassified Actinotalea]
MDLPVMPPVAPMLAKSAAEIPPGQLYEPKWDGFRSVVFRDGDDVEIGSRNTKPMTRYFPEVVEAVRRELHARCVVDGEIVVASADGSGLDFEALLQRIHPAESRVRLLAEQTPAVLVVFDLLALGDEDLTGRPFAERRAALERAVTGGGPGVYLTRTTTDLAEATRWFSLFEGAGLDGVVAKRPDLPYQPDKRVMTKVKHERTADCVVAGYRVHKADDAAVGSLLLGLYDDAGTLTSIGVTSSFPMARRRELFAELQALVTDAADHPWTAQAQASGTRTPTEAAGSRWNSGKDLSFVPLRPERVVEVRYDHMEGTRLRHTAQFARWRPDREPESCTFAQLEVPVRFALSDVLG